MKALGIIAAAVVGFFTAPSAANAYVQQPVAPSAVTPVSHADLIQRWDDRRDRRWDDRRDRRWDRRGRYDRRDWNRGRHRGWRNSGWRWRTVCTREWRYGHRERVCRRIRYR